MPVPSCSTVCRTVVVLGYLLALALAGQPGPLAFALVLVWLAPLAVGRWRHRPFGAATGEVLGPEVLAPVALAGGQVSSTTASMPSQMPNAKNSAAAP